jgi:methylenetetrahydrofolate dehydrogenase (NADP+) / methenyltetrahydrofolate cyclohydrolase
MFRLQISLYEKVFMVNIIDGKAVAQELRQSMKSDIDSMKSRIGKVPGLAVVLVGDDPASALYVRNKHKACLELGIQSFEYRLTAETSEDDLVSLVKTLNHDERVNGILVQFPLPKHIPEKRIIDLIDYRKDVDGFHPVNVGKLVIGDSDGLLPCTPHGCQILINRAVKDLSGKHLVVVGRSNLVGKPIANIMLQKNKNADCIVTICHSAARDLARFTIQADILVAAIGKPGFISADMVKEGAVVIDVGMNRVNDPFHEGKTIFVGDVKFDEVSQKASAITPVPGGVGPMTITMLMENTIEAFKRQNNL